MSAFGSKLTRQEWNSAYLLGLREVVTGRFRGTFDARVRRGLQLLASSGYEFECAGLLSPRDCSGLPDEHDRAERELAEGEFDTLVHVDVGRHPQQRPAFGPGIGDLQPQRGGTPNDRRIAARQHFGRAELRPKGHGDHQRERRAGV